MTEMSHDTDGGQSKRERQRARKAQAMAAAREAQQAEQKKTTIIVVAIIAAVAVLIFGAYWMYSKGNDPALGFAPVSVEGEALPTPEEPDPNASPLQIFEGDNAVGKDVPTIKGKGFDGTERVIGKGAGKPQAIAIVAHWCHHCQDEVKAAKDWVAGGYVPEGLEIVALTTQNHPQRPNWPPTTWFEQAAWPFQQIHDAPAEDGSFPGATALGVASFPTWVFTDAEGKVKGRVSGAIGGELFKQFADATLQN